MRRSSKIFVLAGCLLIIGSFALLAASRLHAARAQRENAEVIRQIEAIIPARSPGIMDEYLDMEMPALQINGQDYIAVVEIPGFGVKLPVGGSWDAGQVTSFPCRFWGTVYNGSLVLGGADQTGQFDCLDQIGNGSIVTVTDMTGGEFTYVVTRIGRSKSAQAEILLDNEADLTLFVRDAYNFNYIIVRCTMENRNVLPALQRAEADAERGVE